MQDGAHLIRSGKCRSQKYETFKKLTAPTCGADGFLVPVYPLTTRITMMMMTRWNFSTALIAVAATSLGSTRAMAASSAASSSGSALPAPPKARNVVLAHGLFADGSCWTEVIARLQAKGLKCTAVQNPLTTL